MIENDRNIGENSDRVHAIRIGHYIQPIVDLVSLLDLAVVPVDTLTVNGVAL